MGKKWQGLREALRMEATRGQQRQQAHDEGAARERLEQHGADDAAMRARANEVLGPPAFGSPEDASQEFDRLMTEAGDGEALLQEVRDGTPGIAEGAAGPPFAERASPRSIDAVLAEAAGRAANFDLAPTTPIGLFVEALQVVRHEVRHLDGLVDRRGQSLEDLQEAVSKRDGIVSRELEALRDSLTRLDSYVGGEGRHAKEHRKIVAEQHGETAKVLRALERQVQGLASRDAGAGGEVADVQESVRTLVRSVEHLAGEVQRLEAANRGLQEDVFPGTPDILGDLQRRLGSLERNVAGHEGSLAHLARVGAEAGEQGKHTLDAVHVIRRGLEDVIAAGDEKLKAAAARESKAQVFRDGLPLADVVDVSWNARPAFDVLDDATAASETRVDFGGIPVETDERMPEGVVVVVGDQTDLQEARENADMWHARYVEADRLRERSRGERRDMLRRLREVEGQRDEANGALLRLAERVGLEEIPGPDEIADEVAGEVQAMRMERERLQEKLDALVLALRTADEQMTGETAANRVAAWRKSSEVRGETLREIAKLVGHSWSPVGAVPDPERVECAVREAMARADAPGEAWERVATALRQEDHVGAHALASCVEDAIAERDSLRDRKADDAAAEDTAIVRQMKLRLGMDPIDGTRDPIDRLDDVLAKGRATGAMLGRQQRASASATAHARQALGYVQRVQHALKANSDTWRLADMAKIDVEETLRVLRDVE